LRLVLIMNHASEDFVPSLQRYATAPQLDSSHGCADLVEVLFQRLLKEIEVIFSEGLGERLVNRLLNRQIVMVGKLQGFRRICHLPNYICGEGPGPIKWMLHGGLMGLQRKFTPADEGIGPE
jgi:hypothetical protein